MIQTITSRLLEGFTGQPNVIKLIAERYREHEDDYPKILSEDILMIRRFVQQQFGRLSDKIYFKFVDEDPYDYKSFQPLADDAKQKGTIQVNTSGNDSKFWGKFHNLQFRAIHDYVHAVGKLDFDLKNELIAFECQMIASWELRADWPFMDWELYGRILRSEIVYQAYVKTHFNQFHIDQKIILDHL